MEQSLGQRDAEKIVFTYLGGLRSKFRNQPLSEVERTIILVYELGSQVTNGGLHQFFANPSGNYWLETLQALRGIEATRIIDIYERALAIFPESQPYADQAMRLDQLEKAGDEGRKVLNELTDEYCGKLQ